MCCTLLEVQIFRHTSHEWFDHNFVAGVIRLSSMHACLCDGGMSLSFRHIAQCVVQVRFSGTAWLFT